MKSRFLFITCFVMGLATIFVSCGSNNNKRYDDSTMQAYLADSVLYAGEDTVGDYILTCGIRQPLQLEEEWKNDSVVIQLLDHYNIYEIINSINTDEDALNRYEDDDRGEYAKKIGEIDVSAIINDSARVYLKELLNINAENFAIKDDAKRQAFVKQVEPKTSVYNAAVNGYLIQISKLVDADDKEMEDIEKSLSPTNWMSNVYTDFAAAAKPDSAKVSDLFEDMLAQKKIDKRAAMLFAIASTSQMDAKIIPYMEQLMESGEYSPMLPLLWRAYRVSYNNAYSCPSTSCYSPNIRYNHYRRLVAHTLLHHIHDNPNDKSAIVNFYFHARRASILRFGQFFMGNEGVSEQMRIFDDEQVL